ncbi:dihydrofolate reductase [Aplysia californica]|uniref:dihydrofolate reductase n=1 Tax=Aplysia californica TaxID=6500 RepID=A0ABM0ZWK2_APLCA|nr:dihydrofolate reductase [Aplysia californica]
MVGLKGRPHSLPVQFLTNRRASLSCVRSSRPANMTQKLVACVSAFSDGNRGIGYKGDLPWPKLQGDEEYYRGICKRTVDPNKKNGIIVGRLTWESGGAESREERPKEATIVISRSLSKDTRGCVAVVSTLSEAIDRFMSGPGSEEIENIYVLGGTLPYQDAIQDKRCSRLYLTRVYQDFPCDATFPAFEHSFHRVTDSGVDDCVREDNGVKYRFEVWERNVSGAS